MEQSEMTWKDVMSRGDIIGGELKIRGGGYVFCGLLADIREYGSTIRFTLPWLARWDPGTREWRLCPDKNLFVSNKIEPVDLGSGRILIRSETTIRTIYPRGDEKLDTEKVIGLPSNSARFLALYPELPFDIFVAEQVLVDYAWLEQQNALIELTELPVKVALSDVLAILPDESMREQFLWRYVEGITGERRLHLKVY